MRFDKQDKVVKAPDALGDPLYRIMIKAVIAADLRKSLIGTKEEVLAKAAKMNAKNRHFIMPTDNKAHYTDHLIQGQYHCIEIDMDKKRRKNAILFVFGGGMILGSDKGDIGLSRKIAEKTGSDVWFPYYPLCHEHDMLENVQMIFECYEKMLTFYKPENIVFLGFSAGGALILDLITYINELNDSGRDIPMPGLLIPISPGSVPVTEAEKTAIKALDKRDIMIPAEYMFTARDIMCHGRDIPEKYLATAHGDFRGAPITHFYYGSAETLFAFAPSYAESYRKAGAKCVIHVGKGMHHCYAIQYFIPGCKPAFDEIMRLITYQLKKHKKG
ncbi:MAG: alpha/beta hydrolase [Oscillospiraceae bacterium]|nr:alpha/beta hydrolase [Oscillospiraceae bacterium]